MSVWIVDVPIEVDQSFRRIVEKKYGPGEQVLEIVLHSLMKEWVGRQEKGKTDAIIP
ncbi:MAG: hypothetical protein AABW68_01055 [archaeon]